MTRLATAAALAVLASGTLLVSTPATAVGETCQGRPATIVGTSPLVVGTPGDDVIVTGTSETAQAGAGNDLICVTASDVDVINIEAGDGDDVVDASTSTTSTWTFLGAGRDRFLGGPDRDDVHGEGADDDVSGGGGYDVMIASVGDVAGAIAGSYDGGDGADSFTVWSRVLDVELFANDEVVVAGVPAATLGSFDDTAVVAPRAIVHGDSQDNNLGVRGCEIEAYGKGGNDSLDAHHLDENMPRFDCDEMALLVGGAGDDELRGSDGRDRIIGGNGDDRLDGRPSQDLVLGGPGDDELRGGNSNDELRGGRGNDSLIGNPGKDTLLGNGGRDSADGDDGRDRCVAEREQRCER